MGIEGQVAVTMNEWYPEPNFARSLAQLIRDSLAVRARAPSFPSSFHLRPALLSLSFFRAPPPAGCKVVDGRIYSLHARENLNSVAPYPAEPSTDSTRIQAMDNLSVANSPTVKRPYEEDTDNASSFNGESAASVAHGYVANSVAGPESLTSRRSATSKPTGPSSTCAHFPNKSDGWTLFMTLLSLLFFQWVSPEGHGCLRRGKYFLSFRV